MLPKTPQSLLMTNKSEVFKRFCIYSTRPKDLIDFFLEAEKSFRFYNHGNEQKGEMNAEVRLEYEELCSSVKNGLVQQYLSSVLRHLHIYVKVIMT